MLGYIISANGIRGNPEKTKAISSMKPPTNVSEVRTFLGMTGYYRQLVPDYAKVAAPLTALTKKRAIWHWTDKHELSFKTLKELMLSDQILAYPHTDKPYKLYTDACDYAVGGILVQVDDKGIERVIQYVSH